MPHFSFIIVSHNKPGFVKEAIDSLLAQTDPDWQAYLIDSGVLYRQGFFDYLHDPRIEIGETNETPDMQKSINVSAWCVNRVLNTGKLTGELLMWLCDDDLLYPEAFETFWNYYVAHNREPQAMYASQHIGVVTPQGGARIIGQRLADRPAGTFCRGRKLDCKIDYLQFCNTLRILERFRDVYHTTEYLPEGKDTEDHADGIYMEKLGAITKVHNINKFVSINRRVPGSLNSYYESKFGFYMGILRRKVQTAKRRVLARF